MTFWKDAKKPYNLLMLVLTVLSIGLAFYFYQKSKVYHEVSFKVDKVAKLFDLDSAANSLRVMDGDSIIKDNVYLITGIIWNSGNLPIESEEVREALTLQFPKATRILDFKISVQEPSLSGFRLLQKDSLLELSWKYFDPMSGLRFQVLLTANEEPTVALHGRILGVREFIQISDLKDSTITFSTIGFYIMIGVLYLIIMFGQWAQSRILYKDLPIIRRGDDIMLIVSLLATFLMGGLLIYKGYVTTVPEF